jgi:hypothetical protein
MQISVTMKYAAFMIVAVAATLASCTLDAPQTAEELDSAPGAQPTDEFYSYVAAEDPYVLAAPECLGEDDCELAPEQTYAQCVAACNAGVAAIERFCFTIPHPVVKASCLAMRFGGPVVCANWCYWYLTPH